MYSVVQHHEVARSHARNGHDMEWTNKRVAESSAHAGCHVGVLFCNRCGAAWQRRPGAQAPVRNSDDLAPTLTQQKSEQAALQMSLAPAILVCDFGVVGPVRYCRLCQKFC